MTISRQIPWTLELPRRTNSPSPERTTPLSEPESDHMLEQSPRAEPARPGARSQLSDESLIGGKQLRKFLGGCSEMHIWRLLNCEKNRALAFPRPIKINDRNYWRLGAVRQWVCEREAESQPLAAPTSQSRKQSRPSKRSIRRRSRAS